jgi:hypothetical protein
MEVDPKGSSIIQGVKADIDRPSHGPDPAGGPIEVDPRESTHECCSGGGETCTRRSQSSDSQRTPFDVLRVVRAPGSGAGV